MIGKWRVVVCLTVIFILYVSYKILEPDIKREINQADSIIKEVPVVKEDNFRPNEEEGEKDVEELVKELQKKYWINFYYPLKDSPWRVAERMVTEREVHPEYAPEIGSILKAMATRKILSADTGYKGTQLKLSLILEGGQIVAFKPKW